MPEPSATSAAPSRARDMAGARPRRVSYAQAAGILATRDPVVAGLIAAGGPIRIGRRTASHFAALVEAIVYQQLAGAAARAIHGRWSPRSTTTWSPRRCWRFRTRRSERSGCRPTRCARCATSLPRCSTGRSSCRRAASPANRTRRSSPASRAFAASGRGRPRCSSCFTRRLDVWPVGDYGVRQGYVRVKVASRPCRSSNRFVSLTALPHSRAWYCWRAVELYAAPPEARSPASRSPRYSPSSRLRRVSV